MAISDYNRVELLKYSLEKYINDNLGSSYTFNWEGMWFESGSTANVDEWIQEKITYIGEADFHVGTFCIQPLFHLIQDL